MRVYFRNPFADYRVQWYNIVLIIKKKNKIKNPTTINFNAKFCSFRMPYTQILSI